MAATYVKAYEMDQTGTSGFECGLVLPVSNPDGGGREWFLLNSPHRFAFDVDPPAATPPVSGGAMYPVLGPSLLQKIGEN